MTSIRIHLLVCVQGYILLVFYSDANAWQFRAVSGSAVFGERKLYYSAVAAEKAGREWIVSGS